MFGDESFFSSMRPYWLLAYVLLGTASSSGAVISARPITGQCTGDPPPLIDGVRASTILAGIKDLGSWPSTHLAWRSLLTLNGAIPWEESQAFLASLEPLRSISQDLFQFLMMYNQKVGILDGCISTTADIAFAQFQAQYPNTVDTCTSMLVWYRTFCAVKGGTEIAAIMAATKSATQVVLSDQHLVALIESVLELALPPQRKHAPSYDSFFDSLDWDAVLIEMEDFESESSSSWSTDVSFPQKRQRVEESSSSVLQHTSYVDHFYKQLEYVVAARVLMAPTDDSRKSSLTEAMAEVLGRPESSLQITAPVMSMIASYPSIPFFALPPRTKELYETMLDICKYVVRPGLLPKAHMVVLDPKPDIVTVYKILVDLIRSGKFTNILPTSHVVHGMIENWGFPTEIVATAIARLRAALFLQLSTLVSLTQWNSGQSDMLAYSGRFLKLQRMREVREWYRIVMLRNVGKTIGAIGVSLQMVGAELLVAPPPELLLPLAEAGLALYIGSIETDSSDLLESE